MCWWPILLGMGLTGLFTWWFFRNRFKVDFMHKVDQLESENRRLQLNLNSCKDHNDELNSQINTLTEDNADYLSKLASVESELAAVSSDEPKALSLKTLDEGNTASEQDEPQEFDNLADMKKRVVTDNYTNPEQISADVDVSNIEAALSANEIDVDAAAHVSEELTNEQIDDLVASDVEDIDAALLVDIEDTDESDTADIDIQEANNTNNTAQTVAATENTKAAPAPKQTNKQADSLPHVNTGERSAFIASVLGGVSLAAAQASGAGDEKQQLVGYAQTDEHDTIVSSAKTVTTPYGNQYQNKHLKTDDVVINKKNADEKNAGEQASDKQAADMTDVVTNNNKSAAGKTAADLHTDKTAVSFDKAAAKAALGKNIKLDDLKVVEGIGPKIAGLFNKAGIRTWQALSETPVADCKEILDAAGSRYQMHDPSTWPEQAGLAAKGEWEALAVLQDSLKGGRKV